MASIKAKVTNAIEKLTHKSHDGSTTSSLADTDGVHTSHAPSPTHSVQSSVATTGALDSPTHTHDRGMTTAAGATGVSGIAGYHNATPTGIDSAGYNTVTGTSAPITATAGHRDGLISESEIIDSKTFTKTVDHEVLIEKKTYVLEHRPVQETYVVETRKVGEGRVPGHATEIVGREVNEVDHKTVAAPRGERTVIVQDVDVPLEDLHISGRTVQGEAHTMGAKHDLGHTHDAHLTREV